MKFEIKGTDSKSSARTGAFTTDHGVVQTPIFMPVGTQATVKTVHQSVLKSVVQAEIILGNTYHLYLRPGMDIMRQAGGLHQFMNWDRPMLTDSGGYQVYSLSHRRKITEEGVQFYSHIDGSKKFFTPEYAIDVQRIIGADIIMAFDECTPYPCTEKYARESMHLTHRWLKRCVEHFDTTEPIYGHEQILAPIVQGSVYPELRKQSAEEIASYGRAINAIGGLSVGEPTEDLYAMTDLITGILPADRPRYLMGVGTPANLLECIALGIDMFDCVLPTRNARHGLLYTSEGIINIKNAKWADDFSPIDANSPSEMSRTHTKAYLRHLFRVKEGVGAQIASVQNLSFFIWLVQQAREHIQADTFSTWKDEMLKKVDRRL